MRIRYGAGSARRHCSRTRSVRKAVHQPDLAESPGVGGRRDSDPGTTYCYRGLRSWAAATSDYARYHEVLNRAVWSPRVLLMLLLQHLDHGDAPLVFGIDETLERRRGPRIHPGHLPRRGAFQSPPCQGQRPALDLPDVVGPCPLGRSALGPAGAHGAGAIGTVPPTAGTSAQETHRLGQADDTATASLAAATPAGAGGRQRLRRAGPAPPLPVPPGTRHPDRPFAYGCRPYAPAPVSRDRTVARRSKARGGPRSRLSLTSPKQPGPAPRWPGNGAVPDGGRTAPASPLYPFAGCYRPPGLLRPAGPTETGGGPDPDPAMVCAALELEAYRRGRLFRSNTWASPAPVVQPGHRRTRPPWPPTCCRTAIQ